MYDQMTSLLVSRLYIYEPMRSIYGLTIDITRTKFILSMKRKNGYKQLD